jgi:molybdopterin converting factor small subunit
MVKVRVLFFGKARELVNTSECEIELDNDSMTCRQLEEILFEKVNKCLNLVWPSKCLFGYELLFE